MNEQEAKLQRERLVKFNELSAKRDKCHAALESLTDRNWKELGPCGQGPFTSNMRESRQVLKMDIYFSATMGGAPSVTAMFEDLFVSAHKLGKFLEEELRERLKLINEEMEKI